MLLVKFPTNVQFYSLQKSLGAQLSKCIRNNRHRNKLVDCDDMQADFKIPVAPKKKLLYTLASTASR